MNRDEKKFFPSNLAEALTLIWLSKNDLGNNEPEWLCSKYFEMLKKFEAELANKSNP